MHVASQYDKAPHDVVLAPGPASGTVDNVTDLASRRESGDPPLVCDQCGGEWFTVEAVCLRTDYTISGYAGRPTCLECSPSPPTPAAPGG